MAKRKKPKTAPVVELPVESAENPSAPLDLTAKHFSGAELLRLKTALPDAERLFVRRLRYWCYRKQNEATGGARAGEIPAEFETAINRIQASVGFPGWRSFASTWDIDPREPTKRVKRQASVWREWAEKLHQITPVLDLKELGKRN